MTDMRWFYLRKKNQEINTQHLTTAEFHIRLAPQQDIIRPQETGSVKMQSKHLTPESKGNTTLFYKMNATQKDTIQ